eukprot:CAMPEP_0197182174 /NCGR_PEP_ID=MMETSP1423-20130617/6220_1 /TAXON_ID=476441 /ORGANISM="Pseudo-nitzschia heimii, Strain UNC1101" /LENGTH=782 /DNA_ID=CAMNT_0042632555 /DNA_START=111 /DNA_END=2459 /DNA_ORIENTATION=+
MTNTPKNIFILVLLLCIFQQLSVWRTYSKQYFLPVIRDSTTGRTTVESDTLSLPKSQSKTGEDEEIAKIIGTTQDENIPKVYNRVVVNNENKTTQSEFSSKRSFDDVVKIVNTTEEENIPKIYNIIVVNDENKTTESEFSSKRNFTSDHETGEDNIERALVISCFEGCLNKTNIIRRFVWSARNVGKFTGWIILLTDSGEGRYEHLTFDETETDNEKFVTLRLDPCSETACASYVFGYLSKDSRLDEVSLVYLLNVNSVFGNPVWPLFHDLEQKYQIGSHLGESTSSLDHLSSASKIWMFGGSSADSRPNGWQMILDRTISPRCIERFRLLMHSETQNIDRVQLVKMLNKENEYEIVMMSEEEKHIIYPSRTYIDEIVDDRPIPVLINFENFGGLSGFSVRYIEIIIRYFWELKHIATDVVDEILSTEHVITMNNTQKMNNNRSDDVQTKKISDKSEKIITACDVDRSNATDYVERAMFVISMGEKAAKTKTIERFIYSARQIGEYCGWIVVLTDAPPGRYDRMKNWTNNVIIMEPREEDLKTHYNVSNMIYKRFKTYPIEYMDRDARLDRVEVIYYLDADIVFGNNMLEAFYGLESTYGIGRLGVNSTVATSLGRGRMWMFRGNSKKWQIQGGQIIIDRHESQPCLERWRKGFDSGEAAEMGKDQYLLMDMKAEMDEARNASLYESPGSNHTVLECEIVTMEQKPYLEFPSVREIRKRSGKLNKDFNRQYSYSAMVHVRNDGGTATMRDSRIKPYMKNLLRFKKDQKDKLGILKKVRMEIT